MKRDKALNRALSIFFTILSLAWIYPVFMIALNSFKKATAISTTTAFDLSLIHILMAPVASGVAPL